MDKALKKELKALLRQLLELRQTVHSQALQRLKSFAKYYPHKNFSKSSYNLAYYLSLRTHDLRPLQSKLAAYGFSSMGRGGGHVMENIEQVSALLAELVHHTDLHHPEGHTILSHSEGDKLLGKHTDDLFGHSHHGRNTRIMVTLPTEAARDDEYILKLMEKGMDCARINCAHDDAEHWQAMIENIRKAEKKLGQHCRILMDLAGHKLRTGAIERGPAVRHIKVRRDVYGHPNEPTELILYAEDAPAAETYQGMTALPIPAKQLKKLQAEDRLFFTDGRGKPRSLLLTSLYEDGSWLSHCEQSSYVVAGSALQWQRPEEDGSYTLMGEFNLSDFEGTALPIRLFKGDKLLLTRSTDPGHPARFNHQGNLLDPASISCTLPEVIEQLETGARVWFDDGKLGCTVQSINDAGALLEVCHAAPKGVSLHEDKGINFPDTQLKLPSLSEKDKEDLAFVCKHADMVGFSFVETIDDMDNLLKILRKHKARDLPIIAKIETALAVRNLPDILLATLGRHPCGIMIARGDLCVEIGSVRLAEVQEEILWLCEAAQVPVIWATQVLETLAKKGLHSRPEFTDAAMADRAECVMLNKGPYILDAIEALSDVLLRMQAHQLKRFPYLSPLPW